MGTTPRHGKRAHGRPSKKQVDINRTRRSPEHTLLPSPAYVFNANRTIRSDNAHEVCYEETQTCTAHKSKSSAPAGALPAPLPAAALVVTNDPNPPVAGGRGWLCAPHIPLCAFSFSRSRMLLPAPADAEGLLVATEPRDIDHKSSNPPPLDLVDLPGKGAGPPTGDVTAERAALIARIAAYEGAATGVELGRACDEGVSTVLNAPNGCVCTAGCVGR